MKGLILAGGFGTRLRPLTYTGAKQLIPIANKPIIFYGIETLIEAGIKKLGIVIGESGDEVKGVVGDGRCWDIEIDYIPQPSPLGLAHAIKISKDFLGDEPFVMYLGDNLLKEGVKDFVDKFNTHKSDVLILLTEVPNPQDFGVAQLAEDGRVINLVEKPKEPPSNLALVGIYIFNKNIFTAVENIRPSWRNELEITDAIQWLIDNNYKVESHKVKEWWKDTGRPEDIIDANLLVLEGLEPSNQGRLIDSTVNGKVVIEPDTVIEKSTIRGPVIIGRQSRIIHSYIGPFTSVGNNVIIENSEIECSVIMDDTRIRNIEKRIDRSILGRGVFIEQTDHSPRTHRFILGDQSYIEIVK